MVSEEVVPLGPWRREQPPDVAWRRADGGRPHSAQTDKGPPPPSATAPAVIRLHVLGASRGFHVTRDAPAGQLPTVMGGQGAAEGLKRKLLPLRSPPPVPASAWEGAPPHTHTHWPGLRGRRRGGHWPPPFPPAGGGDAAAFPLLAKPCGIVIDIYYRFRQSDLLLPLH